MNNHQPSINLAVDPTNPGQFFACCGLLELAHRLSSEAHGWFDCRKFFLSADRGLKELLSAMIARRPEPVTALENGLTVKPIIAPLRLALDESGSISLMLDSWMRIGLDK